MPPLPTRPATDGREPATKSQRHGLSPVDQRHQSRRLPGAPVDGTATYVDIPITTGFLAGPFVSMSAWINFTVSLNASFIGGSWSGDEGPSLFCDGPYSSHPGAVRGAVGNSDATGFIEGANPGMNDGQWHHFVFSSDGTKPDKDESGLTASKTPRARKRERQPIGQHTDHMVAITTAICIWHTRERPIATARRTANTLPAQ